MRVNGKVIAELGFRIDPEKDSVKLDGKRIRPKRTKYYAVNKPIGYISSSRDDRGRPRVIDLIPSEERLFTVGRLDINSSGLIIVTNDGELANKLSHPSLAPEKEYHVTIKGELTETDMERLSTGILLDEGRTAPAKAVILWSRSGKTGVSITVKQGWYRMVRRMFMTLGKDVRSLKRVRIGTLTLKGIEKEGRWRELTKEEVERLIEKR